MKTRIRLSRWTLPLLVLAALMASASVSYGYAWFAKLRAEDEYKQMIYNISMTMGEHPSCID